MKDSMIHYSVGALLYCPANQPNLVDSLVQEKFGRRFSLALCLEDTIRDEFVAEAEAQLFRTLAELMEKAGQKSFYLPKIFVRPRSPEQLEYLSDHLDKFRSIITGFILPKVSLSNIDLYVAVTRLLNQGGEPFYIMPIMENPAIANLKERALILTAMKEKLDEIKEWILNIRVGGNDLCHVFGFRRHATETIYDIKPIANILSDIVTVFGQDYIVSGPVWEYYQGSQWESGLRRELAYDRIAGFIGKTVIHPRQIPLVNQAYMVEQDDYDDAAAILGWDKESGNLVVGSTSGERMNEYKTHYNWAQKIIFQAQVYGIKGQTTHEDQASDKFLIIPQTL